jgi:MSHA pilin protein MshA
MAILAGVAIPRYVDLRKEARAAKIGAIYGDLQAATKMVHAVVIVRGDAPSIVMEGVTVDLVNGYPAASVTGIIAAANLDETRDGISINQVAGAPPYTLITYSDAAATVSGTTTCQVTYTEAASGGAPSIAKDVSSC